MACPLMATPEAAGRTVRAEAIVRPGCDTSGAVVVATTAGLAGWTCEELGKGSWIVLGEGKLPEGCRPFLRLWAGARREDLELAIDRALEAERLRARLAEAQDEACLARERQLDLARVGIALTAERNLDRLLELILSTARELVAADAGSIYLIEDDGSSRVLRFVLAQNYSVAASYSRATMPLDASSLAGYVALTGEPVSVDDARHLPGEVPYRFNPAFDLATGYHTRSLLTTPIATRAGEVIGVLQLINRKLDPLARITASEVADAAVRPFAHGDAALIRALAAQAAVAIENTRLVKEIEKLFESFVRASVTTIEQRDPSTSGHSLRVAHYTMSLAHALEKNAPTPFAGVRFSHDELTQLRYAAVLHDFGKVGVRESVLTKAKKLSTERLALVLERFRHARTAQEAMLWRRLLQGLLESSRAPTSDDLEALREAVQGATGELDTQLAAVLVANEPAVLESSTAHLLAQVARASFPGEDGTPVPLLFADELRALAVGKGSLDDEERREVESHAVHSYNFLVAIPWPRRLARIPEIAYRHHERLNGRGYPNRLPAGEIPLEPRLIAVADVYDALAAADRPYKRAVSTERAVAILEDEAREGFLDPHLVRLFVDARIFAHPLADPLLA